MAKNGRGAKQTHGDLTTAGVAGGGFGTLIVALANLMPNASTSKTIIIVMAPMLTVGVSGVWLYIKTVYINPYVEKKKYEAKMEYFEAVIADAKEIWETLQVNKASAASIAKAKKDWEQLLLLRTKHVADKIDYSVIN